MTAYCWSLEGMWGPVTDPGIFRFTRRVAAEDFVNVDGSPYRDFDVNKVVDLILAKPVGSPILLTGTSLGCNNLPIVAAYLYMKDPSRIIHGMWGFQASIWGAKAIDGTDYHGIPPNVLFAHLTSSDNPVNAGLGAYRWVKTADNNVTDLVLDRNWDLHPGDGDVETQNQYLREMREAIKRAEKKAEAEAHGNS